jgi:hypothetical protein
MAFIKKMDINPPVKIILISSGQPSLNPRLVKEADALTDGGYNVTVLYQYWNAWGTKMDSLLLQKKKWQAIRIGGQHGDILYSITRIVYKIGRTFAKHVGFNNGLAELAIGRGAWLLCRQAVNYPADLYIAHNLAALPSVVKAAKKNHAKCGFDAEDFHRHETSDNPEDFDVRLKKYIEEKYYPETNYLTASSEEIAMTYKQFFPELEVVPVLNVFPGNSLEFSGLKRKNNALKLFWFSQSVGLSRGIQDVLSAMKILEEQEIEFHILGDMSSDIHKELDTFVQNLSFKTDPKILFYDPIPPDELTQFASNFDIGLATEPGFSINNNNALSNKLFTYINAGLAVVVSDTLAQSNFLKKYPEIGKIYARTDADALSKILKDYIRDKDSLTSAKKAAFLLGKTEMNWENESKKFIALVNFTLNPAHS